MLDWSAALVVAGLIVVAIVLVLVILRRTRRRRDPRGFDVLPPDSSKREGDGA